jgi:Zn finger protein HypA/HybF involved in hydrogenase expression
MNVATVNLDSLPSLCLAKRRQLPNCCAVYFVRAKDGKVLYVGVARSLVLRWLQHHKQLAFHRHDATTITWIEITPDVNGYEIEKAFISRFNPLLNKTTVQRSIRRSGAVLYCFKCEHSWTARAKQPQECPNCKSRNWNRKPK